MAFGFILEGSVAILLAVTIGYCVVLNKRLKLLHADRDSLEQTVADLMQATRLADAAIKELKATAVEADLTLTMRLEEAERFGIELANHISAGQGVMEKIVKVVQSTRGSRLMQAPAKGAPGEAVADEPVSETPMKAESASRVKSALQQLINRDRMRGQAA